MQLKIARIKAGLTQNQLSKKVKMSPSTLVKAEKGNYEHLTIKQMKALSDVLGVSVQELFFSEEQANQTH